MSFFSHIGLFSTIFLLQKINFPIFAPVNLIENGLMKKARFSLYSANGELGQFAS
jgi:hypothetical protein